MVPDRLESFGRRTPRHFAITIPCQARYHHSDRDPFILAIGTIVESDRKAGYRSQAYSTQRLSKAQFLYDADRCAGPFRNKARATLLARSDRDDDDHKWSREYPVQRRWPLLDCLWNQIVNIAAVAICGALWRVRPFVLILGRLTGSKGSDRRLFLLRRARVDF